MQRLDPTELPALALRDRMVRGELKATEVAAAFLAGHVELKSILRIQSLQRCVQRFFRGVVGFTQVSQDDVAESIMFDFR